MFDWMSGLRAQVTRRLRVDRELAMDNMMGTMIGVLFLAIISTSFAGVFMAYNVTTAKAKENSGRSSVTYGANVEALNGLYVDSVGGRNIAEGNDWTVLSSDAALHTSIEGVADDFKNFTWAAERPLGGGKMSQWGELVKNGSQKGLVKMYSATPKAGVRAACNWTVPAAELARSCVLNYNVAASVVSPPPVYELNVAGDWANQIDAGSWKAPAPNYAAATKQDVNRQKLGSVDVSNLTRATSGVKQLFFVVELDGLEFGKKVSVDFHNAGSSSFGSATVTPTPAEGEAADAKVSRTVTGQIELPANAANVDVFIDTAVGGGDDDDPTVKVSRFIVYQTKVAP